MPGEGNVRVTRVELENIRCFEQLELDLGTPGVPSSWGVVLGDNGMGKTTLLRTIALGLAPPGVASSLFTDVGGPWLRHGATQGRIRVALDTGESTELVIQAQPFGEQISEHDAKDPSLWERLFVCGYGAKRREFGTRSYDAYSARLTVLTLFSYDATLQNPELILRRLGDTSGAGLQLLHQIDDVLMLPEGSVRLGASGLEVNGPWGTYTPIGALGDGYRATLAWILDMLGWALFRDPTMLDRGLEGIVLIDEVEQHLHPLWQRRVLRRLSTQFPGVQFIGTTHSPLCVIGTTDFKDEEISLILLRESDSGVVADDGLRPPRGLRADQVLTSYLFGLETTGDDETKGQIERLSRLLGNPSPSASEKAEVGELRRVLGDKLGSAETALEQRTATAAKTVTNAALHEQSAQAGKVAPDEAVDLEVKRQFQDLLRGL